MDVNKANTIVRDTGIRLLKAGLITRTWGNISQRIDDDFFVITPTGRTYEDLDPDEIVKVNIHTLKHEGKIKPSYEKGLHAETYKLRSDVMSIIHTHQMKASVVASARIKIPLVSDKMKQIIGGEVLCTAYALPGSKKLIRSSIDCLSKSGSKAVLLANHGVVCVGADMENAYQVSKELEKAAQSFIEDTFKKVAHTKKFNSEAVRRWYLTNFSNENFK